MHADRKFPSHPSMGGEQGPAGGRRPDGRAAPAVGTGPFPAAGPARGAMPAPWWLCEAAGGAGRTGQAGRRAPAGTITGPGGAGKTRLVTEVTVPLADDHRDGGRRAVGRVVALGRFRESAVGDIAPRQVLILVEWESRAAFESYRQDPALADLHPHRERGTSAYVWHLPTGSRTCGRSFFPEPDCRIRVRAADRTSVASALPRKPHVHAAGVAIFGRLADSDDVAFDHWVEPAW